MRLRAVDAVDAAVAWAISHIKYLVRGYIHILQYKWIDARKRERQSMAAYENGQLYCHCLRHLLLFYNIARRMCIRCSFYWFLVRDRTDLKDLFNQYCIQFDHRAPYCEIHFLYYYSFKIKFDFLFVLLFITFGRSIHVLWVSILSFQFSHECVRARTFCFDRSRKKK